MDSGNSASLQSSSGGGDDDFDSRCGGGGGGGGGAVDSSPLSALLHHSSPTAPLPPPFNDASLYALQDLATTTPSSLPPLWSSAPSPPSTRHDAPPASTAQPPPRGPRKRTRASRRAPTTVLTTDTSNFRAMVQEFTGIPSPPFAGAPARSRFDHLFPSPYSLRSAAAATSPASLPPYLLRPFAHKLEASPPSTSSPPTSNIVIAAPTAASAAPSTTAVASSDSYQLASAAATSALLGFQDRSSNSVSFQSPLDTQLAGDANCKYSAHPMLHTAGAPPAPRLQDPADLELTHGVMSSERTHSRNRDDGHGGDELSSLVGGASVTRTAIAGGCKTPLVERDAQSTSAGVGAATTATAVAATAAMRTQGVDSWICTSD